ncbi:MAG: AI-2E family transporter [Brumimicrobium sp.]
MTLSFQKLFYILTFLIGLIAAMMLAEAVLIPVSMALLISFILFPIVKKLESWGVNKSLSAAIVLILLFAVIVGGITLFSAQIMNLSDQLYNLSGKLLSAFTDLVVFFNDQVNFIDDLNRDELLEKGKQWLDDSSGSLAKSVFNNTSSFLTGLVSAIIFTFLFLIYRVGLTKAIVAFGDDANKSKIFRMLKNIQSVGMKYLSGMFVMIIILGFANSIGLWIIGIDSPFLFGFLAAVLAIVPYVGTLIGAILPIVYAFVTSDALWVPLAVIALFWVIQMVESNFLSPKIVGSNLNVNPLVAILSLLIGASVWGVAGMILFLPFAAILKVVCEEFEQLKPVAMLISSDVGDKEKESTAIKWVEKIKRKYKER